MFVIAVGAVACLLNWFVATIPPGPVGLLLLLLVLTIGALHCAVRCIALIIHILTRP